MDLLFNTIMLEPNRWTPDHTLSWPRVDLLDSIDEAGFKDLELWGYHVDRIDDSETTILAEGLEARSMQALGVGAYPSFHKEGAEDETEMAQIEGVASVSAALGANGMGSIFGPYFFASRFVSVDLGSLLGGPYLGSLFGA